MRQAQATVTGSSAHSLRRRLLWLVLAAIALVSLLQASTAYRTALKQADELFDHQLQSIANSVRGGLPLSRQGGADGRPFDFQVQIWGPDGVEIFRSTGVALPPQGVLGFSDVVVEGARYRVYSLRSGLETVQIAQNLDERRARARALALRAVIPVAQLAPVLMMAVWWLIDRSLAPVERIRRQVAGRAAEDLSPLPEAGAPQEVLPLLRELNLLFDRVRAAFAAQQDFIADAAHELRSPLTALKLQAQALHRAQDEAGRQAAIIRLNEGIERAIRLAEQLLALARVDSEGARPQEAPPLDLQDLVRQTVGELLPLARARNIDVGLVSPDAAWVRGRREMLEILLRNLLDNAIKYSPEGGQVDITLSSHEGSSWLAIEDNGPGIGEEERKRVFDRFYRGAKAKATGSGLGLAIVHAIATRHGASVRLVRSERLGGLKVEVRFPAERPAAAQSPPS